MPELLRRLSCTKPRGKGVFTKATMGGTSSGRLHISGRGSGSVSDKTDSFGSLSDGLIFIVFLLSLTPLIVGLSCLLCAEEIQGYALRFNTKSNPFLKWVKTPQYVRYLRILGSMAICTSIPLTIIFAKKWFETWFI